MSLGAGARNALLAALPRGERDLIDPFLEPVALRRGRVLLEPGEPVRDAWFPEGAVVSCTFGTSDGQALEVAAIGREGMVGSFLALDGGRESLARGVVQVAGAAVRLPADRLEAALARAPVLRRACLGHVRAAMGEVMRNAACGSLHPADARVCRWLLTLADRTGGDDALRVTHEMLAEALGLARPTVTVIAARLRGAGMIGYRQGVIGILDRRALEAAACECYAAGAGGGLGSHHHGRGRGGWWEPRAA